MWLFKAVRVEEVLIAAGSGGDKRRLVHMAPAGSSRGFWGQGSLWPPSAPSPCALWHFKRIS